MLTKGEKTKLRLLEVASRLIGTEGLESLTVRRLAKKAGVSPGVVTRYFPQIKLLFPAVVDYVFKEAKQGLRVPDNLPAKDWFLRIVEQNFRYFAVDRGHHNRCLAYAYAHAGSERNKSGDFVSSIASSIERITEKTIQLAEQAELTISLQEAKDFAAAHLQRLDGAINHCCLLPDKEDRLEYAQVYLAAEKRRLEQLVFYLRVKNLE